MAGRVHARSRPGDGQGGRRCSSTTATGTPRPGEGGGRAANENTITDWDPVSKQPLFKTAAARVTLVERGDGAVSPEPITASAAVRPGSVPPTVGGPAALAARSTDVPEGEVP